MPSALLFGFVLAADLVLVHGQFGAGGYIPPAPTCPLFKCAAGEKAVPSPDYEIVSYGCEKSGMVLEELDPNNMQGYGKNGGMNLNRCCIERDICKQTCGMTARDCHDNFHKCSQKVCKGDKNCELQAIMADLSPDPYDENMDRSGGLPATDKKCHGYSAAQDAACQCVPNADAKDANEARLKAFYAKHNPEKLDDMGDIKDVEEVWKKWKGFEPKMFSALANKYKDKAVKKLTGKFKPPPRKAKKSAQATSKSKSGAKPGEAAGTSKDAAADFASKFKALESRKAKAVEDEDYDLASELKAEIEALRVKKAEEIERLKAKKTEAIAAEDYEAAKKVKEKLAKLEL